MKMTADDSKSHIRYLCYLNKLAHQYNTYHHSISKKPINVNYSPLTEKSNTIRKLLSLKVMIELELLSIRTFL